MLRKHCTFISVDLIPDCYICLFLVPTWNTSNRYESGSTILRFYAGPCVFQVSGAHPRWLREPRMETLAWPCLARHVALAGAPPTWHHKGARLTAPGIPPLVTGCDDSHPQGGWSTKQDTTWDMVIRTALPPQAVGSSGQGPPG